MMDTTFACDPFGTRDTGHPGYAFLVDTFSIVGFGDAFDMVSDDVQHTRRAGLERAQFPQQ
jgi:hypothetical protein